jgi:hypothetical protein
MFLVTGLWQITIILLSHDLNEQQNNIILLFSNSLFIHTQICFDVCVYVTELVSWRKKLVHVPAVGLVSFFN